MPFCQLPDKDDLKICKNFKEFDVMWTSKGICTAINAKPNELIYKVCQNIIEII